MAAHGTAMGITSIKLIKTTPRRSKGNYPRPSLRDLNKRYGRTIRFPLRSKKGKRLRHHTDSTRPDAASSVSPSAQRNRIILWVAIIVAAVLLGGMSHVVRLSTLHTWCAAINGWYLVLAVLFLPLVGIPMSICGILIGAKFGAVDGMAITAAVVGFHLLASWAIARSWLRKPMEKLMKKTHYKIPSLGTGEYAAVCLLTALIPGPSYTLKNYFLALSKLPLKIILGVGLPANLFAMSPGVLFGSFTGALNWQKVAFLAAYALLLVMASYWVIRIIRNRSRSRTGSAHAAAA